MERASVGLAPYVSSAAFRASIPTKSIEYLAGGLPVASSLPGMLQELLSECECGFTYASSDSRALADGLLALKNDPARRRQLATNARRAYNDRFVAEKVYEQLIDMLVSIRDHDSKGSKTS